MSAQGKFLLAIKDAAAIFSSKHPQEILLFHHNDADGLSSGAILAQAFERKGISVRRFCLEKPYPQVLLQIIGDSDLAAGSVLVFTDFASGMLKKLIEINRNKLPLFVIDHHTVEAASDPSLQLVNCTTFGIPSDPNCSASAIAFFFALALDEANRDLSALGVLGAVGDRLFDSSGKLAGVNAAVAELGVQDGTVREVDGQYHVRRPQWIAAQELADQINALGGVGYFRGGPDIAVKGLRDGCNEAFSAAARSLRIEIEKALDDFARGDFLRQTAHLQWFKLGESFSTFGVKTVGLICEELIVRGLIDESKYLAGFQTVPDEIPGLGALKLQQSKVSMRLPNRIRQEVQAGRRPSLELILPEATRVLGGFVDACHPHAAATTIQIGNEEKLVAELEKAIVRAR